MKTQTETVIMTIYLSSTDKFRGSLLYEAITIEAKNFGITGATVFNGLMGFGGSSTNKPIKFWELKEKAPIVIQLIDERAKVERFLFHIRPWFEEAQKGHMITINPTQIVQTKESLSS